jgi:hypothetical protein
VIRSFRFDKPQLGLRTRRNVRCGLRRSHGQCGAGARRSQRARVCAPGHRRFVPRPPAAQAGPQLRDRSLAS